VTFADYWQHPEIQSPLRRSSAIGTAETTAPSARPAVVQRERRYVLHSDFYAPPGREGLRFETIVPLLDALDKYRRHPQDLSAWPAHPMSC
jgi:hypothetical protein